MANIIFCLMLLLATLPLYGNASPLSQEDERAIRGMFASYYNDWNHHDAKKMADFYASDGDLRTTENRIGKNPKEIEAIYSDLYSHQYKDAYVNGSITSIQLIKPDMAFIDGKSTITGMQLLEKNKYPPLHHHVVFLLVNQEGQWKILVGRPF